MHFAATLSGLAGLREPYTAARAVRLDHSDFVIRVAKGDQILTEQAQAHGRAIRLGQLVGQQRGQPESPKQLAHGRSRPDTTREFVVFFA
jgi:hypothetical protein